MRQWGSSLNHNGMSFFPARIPNNTHLYHGTHTPNPVTGMEWLAFEIEHGEGFSPTLRLQPKPQLQPEDDDQEVIGYIHVYRTKRPLIKLLYVDGMSAAKSRMGTLDSQDLILRNYSESDGHGHEWPWGNDFLRGIELCALAVRWGVEGFVRMEFGFELILYNFSDSLVLESVRQRPSGRGRILETMAIFEILSGASMRYSGITAQRVEFDYSGMVSAFWYNLNLTNPDPERIKWPRLLGPQTEIHTRIKNDVERAIKESSQMPIVGNNWQGIVDMIVTRYSDQLGVLLNLYIDYRDDHIPTSIEQCKTHSAAAPQTPADYLIREAILTFTSKICTTLFSVAQRLLIYEETGGGTALTESKSDVALLIDYLDWTTWRGCGQCAWDEVCLVAVWPFWEDDRENPSCKKESGQTAGPRGFERNA